MSNGRKKNSSKNTKKTEEKKVNGVMFSSEYQPAVNTAGGRKRSNLALIQEHLGVELDQTISREDARNMVKALFLKPVSELEQILARPAVTKGPLDLDIMTKDSIPSVLQGFIQSWIGAVKSGDFLGIKVMLDAAFGVDTFKNLGGLNPDGDPNTLDETDLSILNELNLINVTPGK